MKGSTVRAALLATSALALVIGLDRSADAAPCTQVVNPGLPYTQSGNTCVLFNAPPATSGDVTNTGTVTSSGTIAINVANVSINGNIINSATGSITGGGINLTTNNTTAPTVGSVINNGTLSSSTFPEWAIRVSSYLVVGDVINNGTINNASTGAIQIVNNASVTGNVRNTGTIDNPNGRGIYIYSGGAHTVSGGSTIGGSVSNDATGVITAARGIVVFATTAGQPAHVAGAGGVSNAGTMTVTQTGIQIGSATIDGAVSNSGTIQAVQNGIQIITLASTPGGTTLGTAGAASVGGGISNSGSITSSGTGFAGIAMDGGSVANGITNTATGQITATNGVGILLNNVGTIKYSSGTVYTSIGGPASVTGGISNAGTITAKTGIKVSGLSTVTGGISNTGTINASVNAIDISGAGAAITINQQAGSIAGNILLSTHADVVNISGGGISGNIVGAGVSDTLNFTLGSGTFTYGAAYGFSGINQVNVTSGTVLLNGTDSATAVTVSGGTLGGTGTLAALMTIQSGGTFSPGTPGSPGTSMTVTGNVTFNSGATFAVYVNPTTATNVQITGAASLNGTVHATFASGSYTGKSYSILHATSRTGTFASLTTTNLASGFAASLNYTATDVLLTLTANIGAGAGGANNPNQQNVANAINTFFNNGGSLPANFVTAFTGPNTSQSLSQASGEDSTGSQTTSIQYMTQFMTLLVDPTGHTGGPGGGGGTTGYADEASTSLPEAAMAYAGVLKAPPKKAETAWNSWATGFGGYNKTNGSSSTGASDVTARLWGVAGGVDYRLTPNWLVGVAFAGGNTSWSLAQNLGSGNSDVFQTGVYAIGNFGPAYVSAALAYATYWTKTDRYGPLSDHLTANFHPNGFGGRLEGGYTVAVIQNLVITPYGALQAQTVHTPGYSETDLTGGGFGLTYKSQNTNATRVELGSRFTRPMIVGGKALILRGRLAWAHDWTSDTTATATFQALPDASFVVNGAAPPKDSALTSSSAEYFVTPQLSLIARFEGELAGSARTYAGLGTVRYQW